MRKHFFLSLTGICLCLTCLAGAGSDTLKTDKPLKRPDRLRVLPVAIYTPENGFGFGAVAVRQFKPSVTDPRTSFYQVNALYTTTNRFLLELLQNVYLREHRWLFPGQTNLYKFPDKYYGIGNDTPESNEESLSSLLFETDQQALRRIGKGNWMAGAAIHLVNQWNVETQAGGLLEENQVNGYDGSFIWGLGPAVLYDSRDNLVNAWEGTFLSLNTRLYGKAMGSDYSFGKLVGDFRKYFLLSHANGIVLAWQTYLSAAWGEPTFQQYALLGGSTIMRGYYKGRYRDHDLLATQLECRIPVWRRFGAVVFGGTGDVSSSPSEFTLNELKWSYGAGLRFMVNKEERTNIRVDLGLGKGTSGFYFGVFEAF